MTSELEDALRRAEGALDEVEEQYRDMKREADTTTAVIIVVCLVAIVTAVVYAVT